MLPTNLRYYFARLAGLLDHVPDAVALQEGREYFSKQMLPRLAVELYRRGCRLHARMEPDKGALDFYGPDEDGHMAFWIAHRDAPNIQRGYSVQVGWNKALETIGHCATFKIESWSTRKRELFYYGDADHAEDRNWQHTKNDISRIADFVSAEVIDFVNKYPRPKP